MNYKLLSKYKLDPRKVKVLLFQQGKRSIDFARLTGIHPVDVSRHVCGKGRNPKIQAALAAYLGVRLEDLILPPADAPPVRAGAKKPAPGKRAA